MLTTGWGRAVGAIAAMVALAGPANAADIRVSKGAAGPAILISGDFAFGDGDRFEAISKSMPRATVLFDSPGGNLLAGLQIGEVIHARGFSTLVADGSVCASACAIAWLGGAKRLLASNARLGFHAASSEDGISSGGNAMVGAYMARLGLSSKAVYALTSASPYDMAWLDPSGAKALGISVDYYAGPLGAAPRSPQLATRRPGVTPVTSRTQPNESRYGTDGPRSTAVQPWSGSGMADHDGGGRGRDDCGGASSHSGGC